VCGVDSKKKNGQNGKREEARFKHWQRKSPVPSEYFTTVFSSQGT